MTIRRILATAGGLLVALAVVPQAPLHAQLEALRQDSRFIFDAASTNLLETRLGQLAQSKAVNASVKQFGQQMVTDHNNLQTQLTATISKTGTDFKPGMNDEDKKEAERLDKLSGSEFDRQYMTSMIQHHQQDVAEFQSMSSSARSAEARQIATTGLPVVQRHLTMASQVGSQVGATSDVVAYNPTPTTPTTPTQNPPVGPPTASTGTQSDVNADMTFIRHAGSSNLMEIRLGQVAQSRASNSAVKQFGQRMVDDHTRLQNQLTAVVSATGVSFVPAMDASHQQQASRIERLSGAEFDRTYMQAMIQGHQDDINQFQTQSQSARSTQVRNLASGSLPLLQQHLSLAVQVGSQVGADTTNVTNPNQPGGGKSNTVMSDAEFIRDVGADNTMMVQLAEVAEDNAKDREIREYASREARDHERLQNQWTAVVQRNGMSSYKPGMGSNHREKVEQLKKAKGKDLDRVYMTLMIQQHTDEVSYWQKEGRGSNSTQVRNLVNGGLPTLEQHLSEAKRLGRKIGLNPDQVLKTRTDIEKNKNKDKDKDKD
jgi:putative membrane protein